MKKTILHRSTSKYYQYSQNRYDTLKRKSALSVVTYYITYFHAPTICCNSSPKYLMTMMTLTTVKRCVQYTHIYGRIFYVETVI
jgi:hypothetical protein